MFFILNALQDSIFIVFFAVIINLTLTKKAPLACQYAGWALAVGVYFCADIFIYRFASSLNAFIPLGDLLTVIAFSALSLFPALTLYKEKPGTAVFVLFMTETAGIVIFFLAGAAAIALMGVFGITELNERFIILLIPVKLLFGAAAVLVYRFRALKHVKTALSIGADGFGKYAPVSVMSTVITLAFDVITEYSPETPSRFVPFYCTLGLTFYFVYWAVYNGIIMRDVHEKERNSALEKALVMEKAKEAFLSNISHEMYTPMNAIIGMSVIGRRARSEADRASAFDAIDEAAAQLQGLINNAIRMSELESGNLVLENKPFDFRAMLQNAASGLDFGRKNLSYITEIDENIPPVLTGDEGKLKVIIRNLLSNAEKFTPGGGQVSLLAELEKKDPDSCLLKISVRDTGVGIETDRQELIFSPFDQLSAGIGRKSGGIGLSLALARRILEKMGGCIRVSSKENAGSAFTVTVPLGLP